MRSCARSAPPRRSPASNCKLVARNNEVLATKTTGADGRVDFDPGLSRGSGGSAPGLLVATLADDYGFLSLDAERLRPHRPRRRRPRRAAGRSTLSSTPSAASIAPGETVFVAALLRDAKGAAKSGLPLTLVVKRPDGVEYRRATRRRPGPRRPRLAVPLLPRLGRGQMVDRRLRRSEGRRHRPREFLLEDYVPERLDFTLNPASPSSTPGEPIAVSLDARFLYGAPAAAST